MENVVFGNRSSEALNRQSSGVFLWERMLSTIADVRFCFRMSALTLSGASFASDTSCLIYVVVIVEVVIINFKLIIIIEFLAIMDLKTLIFLYFNYSCF